MAPQECYNLCALASCDEPVESDIVVNVEATGGISNRFD